MAVKELKDKESNEKLKSIMSIIKNLKSSDINRHHPYFFDQIKALNEISDPNAEDIIRLNDILLRLEVITKKFQNF